MKTKLLFTAALMAVTVGTQAVPSTGSSMLVQLLESQRLENNVEVLAEGEETTEEVTQHQRPEGENVDVTDWIVNPGFDDGTTNGWEGTGALPVIVDGRAESISNTWNRYTFDFYQDIQVPNGLYSVSVQEHATIGGKTDLYIQGYDRATALMNWNNGDFTQWVDENVSRATTGNVLVVDGMVRIGVNLHTGHQSQNLHFDNFKLTYVNDGNAEAQNRYDAKVGELRDAMTYPDGLRERVNVAKAEKTVTTDNFLVEYTALEAEVALLNSSAVSDFMELVESYSSIAANLDETAQAAITTAIAAAHEALATVENVDGVGQISDKLTAAFREAVGTQEYVVAEENFDDATVEGWNGISGTIRDGVTEYFNSNFDLNREFANLQEGWYQLTLNGFYRNGGADQGASYNANTYKSNWRVYGGDYEIPLMCLYEETETTGYIQGEPGNPDGNYPGGTQSSAANFNKGKYLNTLNVWVSDGTLKVGIRGEGTDGNRWCCLDNIKLTYKGNDRTAMYDAMQTNAEGLANSFGMTAYANGLAQLQPELKDEAAIADMNVRTKAIIDIVNGMVDFPANLEAYKSSIEEALANSEASEEDKAFYTDLQNLSLANVTSLEDIDVEGAYHNYLSIATPVEGYQFDMTWLLTNPDVTGMPVWQSLPNVGWSTDINGGNQQTNNSTNSAGASEFIEVWTNTTPQIGWILYQNIVVPEGQYKLTADAFASAPSNVCLYAGENKGDAIPQEATSFAARANLGISFASAGETMRLGLKGETDNASAWCGFNNLKLYKVAATDLTLNEEYNAEAYPVTTNTYANVTLTRTLKSDGKWNTFCVPFDMTAEQLEANGITDVRTLESANVEGKSVTLNFSESNLNAVEAGVPYLVKVDASYDGTINVENVLVSAAEPTTVSVEGGVSMTGNYAAGNVPTGAYFISDNAFYLADVADAVSLKGFRAYITLGGVAQANRLLINVDGEVTAVDDALQAEEADPLVDVYSLNGLRLKHGVRKSAALEGLPRGIYVVGGEKVGR